MNRTSLRLAAVLALLASPLAAQQTWTVDTTGAARLIDEGMNRSQVMGALRILADSIGPRLAGSSNYEKAVQWAQARFGSYGIPAHAEAYDYGVPFERGQATAWITAPFRRQMTMWSWAWTNGTNNRPSEGPVVRVNVSTPESLAVYRSRIRGAWLITADPANLWNPDGPAMTAADSAAQRTAQQARMQAQRAAGAGMDSTRRAQLAQFRVDLPYLLRQAGALGRITDGAKDFGLLTMSGSPRSISPLPNAVIGHEDYLMLDRQLRAGMTPRFSATIDNKVGTQAIKQWNVVAEIRGSERPGEVVIVGGHYDSWDLSQGVTDNGTGSMAAMEALRIIQASGLKPKRTIRAVLFGSEEEGLIGSAEYAAAHAAEADSIQAVLVLDNGAGMITGQALQGRNEFNQLWVDLLAPLQSMGPMTVREGNKGGTDHLSFVPQGVPAFNYDQMTRGYNHTHHSQVDSYDKVPEWDMRQASTVMAVTAFELANLPGAILPRGAKSERPSFFSTLKPSPGLERVR
ncbi:MAG TPA: M20/M25/M40 family metallo-hydrolase [Gemmatimonadales bacterium]|nr:M20/M25/M40 family metallo-hydrolase [Gemmatimonadales bacterium]